MKKVKVVSFNFDFKVKIMVLFCVIVAITIITYSFYNICIKNGLEKEVINNVKDIRDFLNINYYEANYKITVNSNKNTNVYVINEKVNMIENMYDYLIDDSLKISINSNEIKISKKNIDYEYFTDIVTRSENNNFISISSIIEIIRKIDSGELSGNIKKIEINENIVYKIHMNDEFIKKVQEIDIIMPKNEDKITQIKMYNFDGKEQYFIEFENFMSKK